MLVEPFGVNLCCSVGQERRTIWASPMPNDGGDLSVVCAYDAAVGDFANNSRRYAPDKRLH
jgi:hypothetical protein